LKFQTRPEILGWGGSLCSHLSFESQILNFKLKVRVGLADSSMAGALCEVGAEKLNTENMEKGGGANRVGGVLRERAII
jgi:hypothetical protein